MARRRYSLIGSTTDLSGYLTASSSPTLTGAWDFSGATVTLSSPTITGTWDFSGATVTLPEASVTAHEAALTILESQITDGSILSRNASNETITGSWTFDAALAATTTTLTAGSSQVLNLKGGAGDHVYLAWYADAAAQSTRSAYMGFPSAGSDQLTIANEQGSQVLISNNLSVSGSVIASNNVIRTTDSSGVDWFQISDNGTIARLESNNNTMYLDSGTGSIYVFSSGINSLLRIYDGGGTDYIGITHDGTSGFITCGNTQYLRVSGITESLRLDDTDFIITDGGSTKCVVRADGLTEGLIRLYNGSNFGLIMRGVANTPYIGTFTGGDLYFTAFNDGVGTLDTTKGSSGIVTRIDFANERLIQYGPLLLREQSSAAAHASSFGALWVQDDTPNTLWFTDDGDNDYPVAYGQYKLYSNASDTVDAGYINGAWYSDNATNYTLTLQASTLTTFPVGAQFTIWNEGTGTLTISEGTGTTLYVLDGTSVTDSAGGCTMGQGGYATVIRKSSTVYLIMGAGVTP